MSLSSIRQQIISCQRCPRLRAYCARVAKDKRAAHCHETYWGRPVPGFGDRRARILILGLAPGAHGANRTGRMFTGDRSGDFLVDAMHEAGLASVPTSRHARDGLKLRDAYLTSVVHCAPPENKPTTREIRHCQSYLEAEVATLQQISVVVALGKIAFDAYWRLIKGDDVAPKPRPRFTHGYVFTGDAVPTLIASYHPSQQNTNTGKLTQPMLVDVLSKAKALADAASA